MACVSDWRKQLGQRSELTDSGVTFDADPALGAVPDATAPRRVQLTENEAVGDPCLDDEQCDDGLDCTVDRCDGRLGRCVSRADHAACSDTLYCNGEERCDLRFGCRPGEPTSCADGTVCTLDWCDEMARECRHSLRDLDGDGDADLNCRDGKDCDDLDGSVSSLTAEVCGNFRDDNCDGRVDEGDCVRAPADECSQAVEVTASGSYALDFRGAGLQRLPGCVEGVAGQADVFVALQVQGEPQSVDLRLSVPNSIAVIALYEGCSDSDAELLCSDGVFVQQSVGRARLRVPQLAPGQYIVALHSNGGALGSLEVAYGAASDAPLNTQCEQAQPAALGAVTTTALFGTDEEEPCEQDAFESYYQVSLDEPRDVQVLFSADDDLTRGVAALYRSDCTERIACVSGRRPIHARSLPAGDYVVGLAADGPTDLQWLVQTTAPTANPAGNGCDDAPALLSGGTQRIDWAGLDDGIAAGCEPGALDTALSFAIEEPTDVLAVGLFSSGDRGAVSLSRAACTADGTLLCSRGSSRPVRALVRDLDPGEYRFVVESFAGLPATAQLATRPARPPVVVTQAAGCASATVVTAPGGTFTGNTANASSGLSASCDFAGAASAPEQLLLLRLEEPQRVVLDASDSEYNVLVNVRAGPACPGQEVSGGCSLSSGTLKSYLDLELSAGDYFIQVDGYAGDSGRWVLDVFTLPPGEP